MEAHHAQVWCACLLFDCDQIFCLWCMTIYMKKHKVDAETYGQIIKLWFESSRVIKMSA